MLGAACGTSALPTDLSPSLQSISRAGIRLFDGYPLTAFIRVQHWVGRLTSGDHGNGINLHKKIGVCQCRDKDTSNHRWIRTLTHTIGASFFQ